VQRERRRDGGVRASALRESRRAHSAPRARTVSSGVPLPAPRDAPSDPAQLRALLRFHRGGAVRVALRASTLTVAVLIFGFGMAPEPASTLRSAVLAVVGRYAPPDARGFLAAVALSFALAAVPRVTLGAHGWLRSLPVRAHTAWRGAVGALCVAQLPVTIAVLLALPLTLAVYQRPLGAVKLAGLALLLPAAAVTALPVTRPAVRALGAVALAAVVPGRWDGVAVAVLALAAADRVARGAAVARTASRRRAARLVHEGPLAALALTTRLTWRAAGGAPGVLRAIAIAALPLAAAFAVRRNNPTLAGEVAERVARVAAALAVAFACAGLAERVHRRRPEWVWARSLPWSAAWRARADAVALLLPACVPALAAGALSAGAAGCALVVAPLCAAAGAAALRHARERHTGATGETLAAGVPAAVLVGLWPRVGVPLALVLAVPALATAVRRDRRAGVTAWRELRHDAAVDPAWGAR
jgi:hypothetical protein